VHCKGSSQTGNFEVSRRYGRRRRRSHSGERISIWHFPFTRGWVWCSLLPPLDSYENSCQQGHISSRRCLDSAVTSTFSAKNQGSTKISFPAPCFLPTHLPTYLYPDSLLSPTPDAWSSHSACISIVIMHPAYRSGCRAATTLIVDVDVSPMMTLLAVDFPWLQLVLDSLYQPMTLRTTWMA